jgi:hypothetical protein
MVGDGIDRLFFTHYRSAVDRTGKYGLTKGDVASLCELVHVTLAYVLCSNGKFHSSDKMPAAPIIFRWISCAPPALP